MFVIETARLYARPWSLDTDVKPALEMYRDPDVVRYIGQNAIDSPEAATAFLQFRINRTLEFGGPYGSWALIRREDDALIGNILLKPLPGDKRTPTEHIEVGWHLRRDAWGKGYATEAGRAMFQRAFGELALQRVLAVTEPENTASIAVMKRLGMHSLGLSTAFYDGLTLALFERHAP